MNLDKLRADHGVAAWGSTLRAPAAVRLLRQVIEDEHGCWIWTASQNGSGYGHMRYEGVLIGSHVAAYRIFMGEVPEGLFLDHLCRTPLCCRPDHLEPVTPHENSLRGIKATKTHCVRGHEFTPDNLVPSKLPQRNCLTCSRERGRAQYERLKWSRPKWAAQRKDVA